ncbi:VIT domain-containing protein [Armatimonas rosea]|uniref:Ca-activated chloride channel family protein n=1 Tax=Armatimonas rosea TaxID=685828 RepID=A0A7W9SLQ7_ARMRO|nr:VIT domain-containing protein [Armatimonas rosea]MBB6048625.1 Ca-activated chloride channel family protein [Armatimonas rosea]
MLNTTRFANTRLDGFSVLEIQSEGVTGFVPLRQTTVTGIVAGPLAELTQVQTFAFSKAAFDGAIEALYRFPLPGDAAVLGVTIRFGEVELVAVLQERAAAEAEYQSAKSQGRQAALVTRESPDVFTLHVAGILPDQEVQVTTHFVQLAQAEEGGKWSLRLPLTTAPRYIRNAERRSPHARGNPLFTLRDPGHRFSLELTLKGATSATCSSHHPTLTVNDEGLSLRLESVLPNQDCVILWRAAASESQIGLRVFTHENVFLAQVAPPLTASSAGLPREVIVLVDHSGSMQGTKWRAADQALTRFLSSLTPQDRFALGLFHSTCRWFSPELSLATPKAIGEAIGFLKRHQDTGGTELGEALEQALRIPRTAGTELARHVLIITDAEVTDTGRLLSLVEREARRDQRRRVSVICIDAAPHSHLVHQLTEKGGGSAHFLTSDPEQDDITTALDKILREWDAPLHTGLTLRVGTSTQELGDLPQKRARWVVGELPEATEAPFTLESQGEVLATALPQPGPAAVKALVGVRRLNALDYLLTGHVQSDEIRRTLKALGLPEIYASDASASLRKLLIEESLRTGVICSLTAFSASRKEQGQVVTASVPIANAHPKGWAGASSMGGSLGAMALKSLVDMPVGTADICRSVTPAPKQGFFERLRGEARSRHPHKAGELFGEPDDSGTYDLDEGGALECVAFSGVPNFIQGEALLYDSKAGRSKAVSVGNFLTALQVRYPQGPPYQLDSGLVLLLFVDNPTVPTVRLPLNELLQQGGKRSLGFLQIRGAHVRLVLVDKNGHWASGAPSLEVRLG